MRRKDQEITDRKDIDAIIGRALSCRLAMCDGDEPYIVPMSYGYDGASLYLHGAGEGKKIDMLKKNPKVCFEIDVDLAVETSDKPCNWGIAYRSVIGFGTAHFVEDLAEKRAALAIIMKHYTDTTFEFPAPAVEKTAVIRIDISSITGKHSS